VSVFQSRQHCRLTSIILFLAFFPLLQGSSFKLVLLCGSLTNSSSHQHCKYSKVHYAKKFSVAVPFSIPPLLKGLQFYSLLYSSLHSTAWLFQTINPAIRGFEIFNAHPCGNVQSFLCKSSEPLITGLLTWACLNQVTNKLSSPWNDDCFRFFDQRNCHIVHNTFCCLSHS
jgi:hypothetical protein